MVRNLLGPIAALWCAVSKPAVRRRPDAATAKKAETMSAAGSTADEIAKATQQAAFAPDNNLLRAMVDLGIDVDDLAMREASLLRDMRLICRSCNGRSRCRRDLATGDFTRRYRHYCPNATVLTLIADNQRRKSRSRPPKGRA